MVQSPVSAACVPGWNWRTHPRLAQKAISEQRKSYPPVGNIFVPGVHGHPIRNNIFTSASCFHGPQSISSSTQVSDVPDWCWVPHTKSPPTNQSQWVTASCAGCGLASGNGFASSVLGLPSQTWAFAPSYTISWAQVILSQRFHLPLALAAS